MENEPANACDVRDDEWNDAVEIDAADHLEGLSIQNQRLATVQEYEEAALSRTDPLAAVIGIGNAYLQRVFEHLGAAVLDVIDSRPHNVEELRQFAPDIRLMLKLRNAIETDLDVQPPDAGQNAFPTGAKSKSFGIKAATSKRELLPKRWKGQTSH